MWLKVRAARKKYEPFLAFFLPTLFVWGAWLLGQWPGLLNIDSFENLAIARLGKISPWVSYPYSLFLILMQSITSNPGLIPILMATVTACLLAVFFSWAWFRTPHRKTLLLFYFLLLAAPLNAVLVLWINRDTFFTLLHVACALYFFFLVFDLRASGRKALRGEVTILSLLTVLTAQVRMESLILLLVVPTLFFLLVKDHANSRRLGVAMVAVVIPLTLLALPTYRSPDLSRSYSITTVVNPLSFFLVREYRSEDKDADRAAIDAVIDYNLLRSAQNDYEIDAFHLGGARPNPTDEELKAFFRTHYKIVWDNLGLFLENRLRLLVGIMGVPRRTYFYQDGLSQPQEFLRTRREALGIQKAPLSPALQRWTATYLTASLRLPEPFFFFVSTAWIALFLCLAALAGFRQIPVTAATAAIILCRLPGLFLLSPAAHFKYVYSLYFFGFLVVPLALAEWRSRRKETA